MTLASALRLLRQARWLTILVSSSVFVPMDVTRPEGLGCLMVGTIGGRFHFWPNSDI
jgi:hypothetical protein